MYSTVQYSTGDGKREKKKKKYKNSKSKQEVRRGTAATAARVTTCVRVSFVRVELGLGRHHRGKLLGRLLLGDGDAGVAGRGLHAGGHLTEGLRLVPHALQTRHTTGSRSTYWNAPRHRWTHQQVNTLEFTPSSGLPGSLLQHHCQLYYSS